VEQFFGNLVHFTHGMTVVFFMMMSFRLYRLKANNRILTFLFCEMVFWLFIQMKDIVNLVDGIMEFTYLIGIKLCIDTWCIPVTMFLLIEITQPRRLNSRNMALLVFPSILLTAVYIISSHEAVLNTLMVYSLLFGLLTAAWVLLASSKYDNYIKQNFSYTEYISVHWVKRVIFLLFLMLVAWALILWFMEWIANSLFYLFQIAVWSYIYEYSKKQVVMNIPQESHSKDTSPAENTKGREIPVSGDISFASKLKRCMENESLYMNANLSLSDVAGAINTNRTYLSDYLNNVMHISFYNFVNDYRVEKACNIILAGDYKLLDEVAERCGFNSLSTFRRAFQRKMNMTPIEYKMKNSKNTDS